MSTSANHDNPVQPRLYSARVDTAAAQFRHRVRPPWYRPAGRATAGSRLPWIPRWPAPGRPVTHAQDRDDPVPWRPPAGSRGSVPSLMGQARHVVHQRPSTQFHSRVPGVHAAIRVGVSPPPMLKTCPKNSCLDAGCVGAADHLDPQLFGSVRSSSSISQPGRSRSTALSGSARSCCSCSAPGSGSAAPTTLRSARHRPRRTSHPRSGPPMPPATHPRLSGPPATAE